MEQAEAEHAKQMEVALQNQVKELEARLVRPTSTCSLATNFPIQI